MLDEQNPYRAASLPAAVSETSSGPPPTTADFMLEIDDVVESHLHSPAGRKQRRTIVISCCVLLLCAIVLLWSDGLGFPSVVAIAFLSGLSASICPPLWRRRMRKACAKIYEDALPWQQTVVLSSDGIKTTTPRSQGQYRWEGIRQIDTTSTHVLFYVNKAQAVIVPARAFRSEAQFHAFIALARQFWTSATGKGP